MSLSDRFARHDETGRATELDPSTFGCPCEQYPCGELCEAEDLQREALAERRLERAIVAVWLAGVGLGLVVLADAVF